MRVLAVDTSSERGSVCVADSGELLGEVRLASSIQHSDRLFRSIEFLFQYLPFKLSDIDLFAAARGPGSFTGLRVGLAAMEAFVSAHNKPGAGISTLEALAWKTGIYDVPIAATMDARRGDVYGGLFRRVRGGEGCPDTLVEDRPPVVSKTRPVVSCPSKSAARLLRRRGLSLSFADRGTVRLERSFYGSLSGFHNRGISCHAHGRPTGAALRSQDGCGDSS